VQSKSQSKPNQFWGFFWGFQPRDRILGRSAVSDLMWGQRICGAVTSASTSFRLSGSAWSVDLDL